MAIKRQTAGFIGRIPGASLARMLTETNDDAKLCRDFRWHAGAGQVEEKRGRKMMIRSVSAGFALVLLAVCHANAAPQGMLNKTVRVSFDVSIPARTASGETMVARRSVQKVMYVSSAGRVFSRTDRQAGRAREQKEVGPGGADGAPSIQGNTIVGTLALGTGASRLVISFDGSFQSCSAQLITGGQSGRAMTWKGISGNVFTATGPATASTPSCSVQAGNAFAN